MYHIIKVPNDAPVIPLTEGLQKRDFIHVDDVLDVMMTILEWSTLQTNGYYPFEVGTGVNTSIKNLVVQLATIAGYDIAKLDFGALPLRSNEVMESKVNLSNLRKLKWTSKIDLIHGLKKVISDEKKLRTLK